MNRLRNEWLLGCELTDECIPELRQQMVFAGEDYKNVMKLYEVIQSKVLESTLCAEKLLVSFLSCFIFEYYFLRHIICGFDRKSGTKIQSI